MKITVLTLNKLQIFAEFVEKVRILAFILFRNFQKIVQKLFRKSWDQLDAARDVSVEYLFRWTIVRALLYI